MKVNMVLEGDAKSLLSFMELAMADGVFRSFETLEADLVEPEPEPEPEPKPKRRTRAPKSRFELGDRVAFRFNNSQYETIKGAEGRIENVQKSGHGWKVRVSWDDDVHHLRVSKFYPESLLQLLPPA